MLRGVQNARGNLRTRHFKAFRKLLIHGQPRVALADEQRVSYKVRTLLRLRARFFVVFSLNKSFLFNFKKNK